MIKLTRKQMKSKLKKWIRRVEKLYGVEKCCYVIEDLDKHSFELRHDGNLYEVIRYYNDSGYNPLGLGGEFASMCDNTNWFHEAGSASIEYFCDNFN